MAEKIVTLRPHHIDRFIDFCNNPESIFEPENFRLLEKHYGRTFVEKVIHLFNTLSSDETDEFILVKNGPDTICYMCPLRGEIKYCLEKDTPTAYNKVKKLGLKENSLYSASEFLEKIRNYCVKKTQ